MEPLTLNSAKAVKGLFPQDETQENDGLTGAQLFDNTGAARPALTYGDIILLPGHIDFGVDDVVTKTKLSRNIELHVPFVSSPMDTVTESEMAIQMALHGGIGFIHYNNTIQEQRKQVDRVKNFKNGFITNPKVLSPEHTVEDVLAIKQKYGFSGIPITENGLMGGKLVGIVTNRDTDFLKAGDIPLADVMTPLSSIVIGLVAGGLVVGSVLFFDRIKIDDPVGAISVHLTCGIWGTLAVGIFSTNPEHSLVTQLIGIACYGAFTVLCAAALFLSIKATMGLRVSEEEELEGLDYGEHGMHAYDLMPSPSSVSPATAQGAEASYAQQAALATD